MSDIIVDLNVLELGEGENPFDNLASKLEKLSLYGADKFDIAQLEQTVLFIERQVQDLQEMDSDKAKIIMQAVNANVMMLDSSNILSVSDMEKNLNSIKNISTDLLDNKITNLAQLNLANFLKNKHPSQHLMTLASISDAFHSLYSRRYFDIEEWQVDLKFDVRKEDRHKPLDFIYTLIAGLNTIEGVKVTLEEIKIGSVEARINIEFEDKNAKNQVKEIFSDAKEMVMHILEKRHNADTGNSTTIIEKQDGKDSEEGKLNEIFSDESKELNKLAIESLRYDNERKKIENERLQLLLFKEKKQILKELIAEGLSSYKDLEFLIKKLPFLKIENGNLFIGENIDIIDKL